MAVKIRESQISKKWFTISEAGKYLGVSQDTLRRWEKKGKLIPRRTIGSHRRYAKKQLERILKQPAEQVFKKDINVTNYASVKHFIPPSQPVTIKKTKLRPINIQVGKKLKHLSSKIFSNNIFTIAIITMIFLLLITSFFLLQRTKSPEPSKPLSPIPTYKLSF